MLTEAVVGIKKGRRSVASSLLAVGLVTISVGPLSGCATNTSSMQMSSNAAGETSVRALALGKTLEVKQIKGEFINGLYRGKVVIVNKKKSTQDLQYQFSWYDGSGSEVGIDGNGWTPFIIYGKDEKTIVGLSPNPDTKEFRINVRDLKANKTFKTNLLGIL